MGQRRYPPLTPSEVVAIVTALGFTFDRQVGSHRHYQRAADPDIATKPKPRSVVTVDTSVQSFDEFLIKSMIRQSNHTREEFYGATDRTARKIGD
jgi:predicted RNA binding protein YcfA (HicA-like mRNA interferase family)